VCCNEQMADEAGRLTHDEREAFPAGVHVGVRFT
jgi:hypothetical protein